MSSDATELDISYSPQSSYPNEKAMKKTITLTLALYLCAVAVAVVLVVTRAHCEGRFAKYANRPNLLDYDYQPKKIEQWLKTLEIKPGSSLPSVLDQLKGANDKDKDPVQRSYFAFLISLATTDADNSCQRHLFNLFLAIYKRIDESKQPGLIEFMDYYGSDKFRACIEYERPPEKSN